MGCHRDPDLQVYHAVRDSGYVGYLRFEKWPVRAHAEYAAVNHDYAPSAIYPRVQSVRTTQWHQGGSPANQPADADVGRGSGLSAPDVHTGTASPENSTYNKGPSHFPLLLKYSGTLHSSGPAARGSDTLSVQEAFASHP